MSKKEDKAYEYSKRISNGNPMTKDLTECAFMVGWDCALKNQWISVEEKLPEYDKEVLILKSNGDVDFCHRSSCNPVLESKDDWCYYSNHAIIAWMYIPSFENICKEVKNTSKNNKN